MKKKRFSWNNIFITATMAMVVFLLLLFAGSSLVTAAEDVDYESLYTYYGLPFYAYGTGSITCADGMSGDVRYEYCEEKDGWNKYSYPLTGFKEIYDLNDPRVVCHLDASLDGCSPDPEEKFSYSVPRAGQRNVPDAFRLFIPPGTVNVTASMHASISCVEGVVLRYRDTPDCFGWPYGRIDAVLWDDSNPGLDIMEERDVFMKGGSGGTILLVPPTYMSKDDDGGWLYVRRLGLDDCEIDTVTIKVTVDTVEFLAWYNKMEQQHSWDVDGDPPEAGIKAAGDYKDPTECEDAGFHWYEDCDSWDGCHAKEECNSDNLCGCDDSSSVCEAVGGYYWSDNTCHAEACTDANLGDCDSPEKCDDSGFFWYNDECNHDPACTSTNLNKCDTPDQCEQGSGFHWYEVDGVEGCHVEPECNVNNLPGCKDRENCETVGGFWYENDANPPMPVCNGSKACTTAEDCDTILKCESSDFFWYDDVCTSESPCGPGNLAGCTNKEACVAAAGGIADAWHPDVQTSSGIRCFLETTGSSGNSSTDPLDFLSELSFSRPTAGVDCDADHLDACNQQKCEALGDGYWWHDGSCRIDDRQLDYNGRIAQAPVRLGEQADDGAFAAGEGMSIIVDTPPGERSYALLIFQGGESCFIDSVNIISEQPVPLTDGELLVTDDICALLQDVPELKGMWTVAILTVPQDVSEFNTLDDIIIYLNGGGVYSFGSYSVDVHCRENVVASSCGPGNLSACVNEGDCKANGGVWVNYSTSRVQSICEKK